MAESPPVVDKGIEQLEKEVTCPLCLKFFDEPKILPCCHYYCKACIDSLAKRAGPNHPFNCPECRAPTTLPQNDPNQLPTAFFLNRMKEVHSKMEKAQGKVEARCEECNGGVSVAFCRQCTEFICEKCVEPHKRMKVFAGHKVVTLEELKEGGAKQILVTKPPPPNCTIHDEPMKAYCFDCSRLICRDCIAINHAGHKSEFTKVATPETKKQLAEKLTPLKEVQASLCKASEGVQIAKSEIVAQGASVAENIEHSFQKLHMILDEQKNRLLEEATKKIEEKVSHLSTQEKGLNTASAVIHSLVDFVEQKLENATDEEFMSIHKQILRRVEREAKEHHKEAIDLDPVEKADMKTDMSWVEIVGLLCQSVLADPSKCTVDAYGPGLKNAEVGKQTCVSMNAILLNGTPTKEQQKVTAELKSTVNGSVIKIDGVQKQENTYKIQFTPAIRGRHQLVVNVNDQPIAGSPFPVCVKIPPTQLGKPVRVIGGLDLPYGVAITSAEEVLVTGREKIAVLDEKGRKLRDIKLPTDKVYLQGIAVDEDDNIYVTDGHCLMKLNKEGKLLKTVKLNDPRGVAVVGDKVFVCGNDGVQLFPKERLEFVKTISLCGQGNTQFIKPMDISHDDLGNMYISDRMKNCIMVLNKQGVFKFSFSEKDDCHLNEPSGVCVVDQIVYVVELGGHCVSVFSRDGKFITSFGAWGFVEGNFGSPRGICVDNDGLLYVCDYNKSRVQVF